jgi:uncharacterized protein
MRRASKFRHILDENRERVELFPNCRSFDICAGGCPHETFLARKYAGPDAYRDCCGWSGYIEHVRSRVIEELRASASLMTQSLPLAGRPLHMIEEFAR